ncbi:MAG: hypothetical protein HC906_16965 [Bacteroidales bacterium]|nr:hypothetical protein [Bacteroidales bacterium]
MTDFKGIWIKNNFQKFLPNSTITLDYLLISKNAKLNIENLFKHFRAPVIILDASNSNNYISWWKRQKSSIRNFPVCCKREWSV